MKSHHEPFSVTTGACSGVAAAIPCLVGQLWLGGAGCQCAPGGGKLAPTAHRLISDNLSCAERHLVLESCQVSSFASVSQGTTLGSVGQENTDHVSSTVF